MQSDATPRAEGQKEILIGQTNREESIKVYNNSLSSSGWKIAAIGDHLVIGGYSQANLRTALVRAVDKMLAFAYDQNPDWLPDSGEPASLLFLPPTYSYDNIQASAENLNNG